MATYRLKVRLPPELRPPETVVAEVNETNRWRVQEKDRTLRRALVTYFRNVARIAASSGALPYLPDPEELYAVMLMRELPGTEIISRPASEPIDPDLVY